MPEQIKKIMVTGATGQIGSELIPKLREKYGNNSVIAVGHKTQPTRKFLDSGPFEFADVTAKSALEQIIKKYDIKIIYHLASLLSAVGEKNPDLIWNININSLKNILDLAKENNIEQIFWPSSIAVFGPETPKNNTPNETIMRPSTMYGVTKVAGELLCEYYSKKYNIDIRSIRYPGVISSETLPGGGTTDYAVAIFYEAVENKNYTCFVNSDTMLPMMYMPDCIKAAIDLMETDLNKLQHRCFNLTAMSFSVKDLVEEIKKHIPDFKCIYQPDYRQDIADSWPKIIDDSIARQEWGWNPSYNLSRMAQDMLSRIKEKNNN